MDKDMAEAELERQIDNWQQILDEDEAAAEWIEQKLAADRAYMEVNGERV